MRVATGGLAASDRITPVSISAKIAPSNGLSTVHHHSDSGVRSSREIMAVPMGRGLSHWWRRLVTGGLMGWKGFEGTPYPFVMPGLDPGIHVSPPERKTWMA